eukprot:3989472-Prymnesium_polylepis.1
MTSPRKKTWTILPLVDGAARQLCCCEHSRQCPCSSSPASWLVGSVLAAGGELVSSTTGAELAPRPAAAVSPTETEAPPD